MKENMPRAERAVILSAGQGSRLLPLTEDLPKCLLDLEGRSMLEWQLRALAAVGVPEAVVITGFRSEKVEAAVEQIAPRGLRVRTLFNPFYKVADNLASCWMARGELRGNCLLINGDTLFEPAIARRLIEAPAVPITLTIDRKPRYDDDDMKVITGFRSQKVEAALGRIAPPGMAVRTLFNPFYKVADNLASCWMARGELRGTCLLLNGDTLFEPAIARRLLDAPAAPITLTIDRKPRYDDDDMKVITEGDKLRAVGKKLSEGVNGESIGFSRFHGDGAAISSPSWSGRCARRKARACGTCRR